MRICDNCANINDYIHGADQLAIQLENRGYDIGEVENIKGKIKLIPRTNLIHKPEVQNIAPSLQQQIAQLHITQYNDQIGNFKKVVRRSFLKQDTVLGEFLPTKPKFVFKKSQNIG